MAVRVSFIGAGKVGCSLARYLAADPARGQKDVELAGFFSASAESARAAADFAGGRAFASAEEAVRAADLVFVTTPERPSPTAREPLPRTRSLPCASAAP